MYFDLQKIIFDRKPFHPLINASTGAVCTLKRFEHWDPNVNHVWEVVKLVKDMFKNLEEEIDQLSQITGIMKGSEKQESEAKADQRTNRKVHVTEHPLGQKQSSYISHHLIEQITKQINIEAIKLYYDDFDSFQFSVAEVVVESRSKVYDPPESDQNDEHQISFGPFNPDIHEEIRKNVLLKGKTVVETNTSQANQAIFYVKGDHDLTIN